VKGSVLVLDVDSVEEPDRRFLGLRCVVRLHPLNHCCCLRRNTTDLSLPFGVSVFRSIDKDRKLETHPLWRRRPRSESYEFTYRVVESGPQVMRNLAANDSEDEIGFLADLNADDVLMRLGVVFLDRSVWCFLEESVDTRTQILQVIMCPRNLQA